MESSYRHWEWVPWIVIAHHSTIFLCYLGGTLFSGIWDDHHRNPSFNNRDHLVGRLTTMVGCVGGGCWWQCHWRLKQTEASLPAPSLQSRDLTACNQHSLSNIKQLNNVLPLQTCQHEMANNAFAIDQAIATKLLLPAMSLHHCWNFFIIVVAIIDDNTLLSTSATLITLPLPSVTVS